MQPTPDLLLKNVRPAGAGHDARQTVDILIKNGVIAGIGADLGAAGAPVHDAKGAYVSGGWMDMHVHLREPGFEHKETIATGAAAAAFGGFTAVACMPNTNPPIHTRDVVEFIRKKAESLAVDVHPIACVSKNRKGESITEMADLQEGGAVAFSDDGDPVHNAKLMRIALEYASMLGMPIINHMEDLALSRPGHMHEGKVSARLGLAGTPSIAEDVMVARDILLSELTGGHVHVAHISTRGAVDLVRQAKAKGLKVTTEVCPHHFDLTDEEIERHPYDTNFKMHPPLRTQDDVDAMIEGLRDGTIDAICTDHAPHSIDEKEVEFIYAPNGIIGLETAWGVSVRRLLHTGVLTLDRLLDKLVSAPRRILNLPVPEIAVGAPANLTIFDTDSTWTFTKAHIRSKSHNTPYIGAEMRGKALAIYNKGRFVTAD